MIRSLALGMLLGTGLLLAPAVHASPTLPQAPYRNCTQARQAGDCDIPSSSDKYQSKLDRDQDGIGCEC